ncbi:MAG: hypothetical protein A2X49_11330 [Lentisphaerae bacterium GWF2_52_8]|nr:MAG: hypothetical protein A2X49_11330 [Lentisphaerae bacterium GWF2_52_8]
MIIRPSLPSPEEMRSFADFCGLAPDIATDILSDYDSLLQDVELLAYYNFLKTVMFVDEKYTDVDSRLNFEERPERHARISNPARFQLLCALSAHEEAMANFKEAGFPFPAFQEAAADLGIHARQYHDNFDENGLSWNSLCWWGNLVRGTVIRQGRLEFNTSMAFFENIGVWKNRKTGTFEFSNDGESPGDDWDGVLKKGDPVIYLHFPAGTPLSVESFAESLPRITAFFKEYIPSYKYRALVSSSWLFDEQFQTLLNPDSNLVRLQKFLRIRPSTLTDCDTIERVFGHKGLRDGINTVPHVTSMQKAFAAFLNRGGTFHSGVIFLFPEELEKYLNASKAIKA